MAKVFKRYWKSKTEQASACEVCRHAEWKEIQRAIDGKGGKAKLAAVADKFGLTEPALKAHRAGKHVGHAYVVDYFSKSDGKRTRRQESFGRRDEADARLDEIKGEMQRGVHTPRGQSKTIAEAGKLWIEYGEAGDPSNDVPPLERTTIDQRKQHLNLHIKPLIGDIKLADLTAQNVSAFARDLGKKGMSPQMQAKVRTSLVSILNYAMTPEAGSLVAQNVAATKQRRQTSGRHKKRIAIGEGVPTREEFKMIIEKAPDRWRPLIVTGAWTGMRASELRGLTWDDVDFEHEVIHVRQRADRYGSLGPVKTGTSRRQIAMAPMVLNTLKSWKLRCPRHGATDDNPGELWLVFPNDVGNVLDWPYFYTRKYVPFLKSCGIRMTEDGMPHFNFHALRHAAASMLIEFGWSDDKIKAMMGHANIRTTKEIYGHLRPTPKEDRADLAAMQARLLA